jgi:DNA polymerase I-like protein with 3'-5' exonuclease and polymerase domains
MNITNPKTLHIIKGLPPVAKKEDRISIDSEFFGQTKSKLHRPHGRFAFLGCSFDGKVVHYIDDETQIQEFYNRIDAGVHIYHHAKYDITQLRRFANIPNRKRLWDTMLLEQIMWSGYYTDYGLNDLVRRYLDTYMPKEVRKEFSEDTVSMTKEQIEYAAVDVAYTRRVYSAQKEKISEDDLQIWKGIELPFLWAVMSMSGVRLDTEKWIALAKKNGEEAEKIQAKYGYWTIEPATGRAKKDKDVFVGINLNSPAQVKKHFLEGGVKLKSTDAEALEKIIADGDDDSFEWRFSSDLLAYRTYAKRSSTYGEKFVTDYVEADGKIYADIYQIGAETGRTSCRAPNLQNQPHESEYRECFVVDEGEVAVVADWGSQEPKFAAHFSQDAGLIDALNSGEKLYVRVAREALNINITKDSPEYTHIKSTILGLFYGMSANGLAKRINVSEDAAQHIIDSILETYPGIAEYMRQQKRAKDYVQSVYGRKIWLNKYSFQWERNALNAPIQSSAADAMKIAAARFVQTKKPEWKLLLLVHDEIVLSVPEKDCEEAEKFLTDCMISVAEEMHEGIKGSAEVFHGSSWGCKH